LHSHKIRKYNTSMNPCYITVARVSTINFTESL
jgi:hypothetical protein